MPFDAFSGEGDENGEWNKEGKYKAYNTVRYNEVGEVFGVFQVDNMSSREERDYLSSADEAKRNPSYVSVQ